MEIKYSVDMAKETVKIKCDYVRYLDSGISFEQKGCVVLFVPYDQIIAVVMENQ
jgi:hypothetical protein